MAKSDSSNFYSGLPFIEDFFNASDDNNYHSLPSDWHVAVTDIVNSTAAINDDRYKTVNILGASPIVGILNITDRNSIPYVFGGDGSSFCIPPELYEDARSVLAASRQIGKEEYGLDIRAAIIPISHLNEKGYEVNVARYRASEHYIQGIFSGGGLSYAEELLKKPGLDEYRIEASSGGEEVDFTGLECRWQEVKQPNKEVITLLVKNRPGISSPEKVYQEVLHKMREIFGFDDKTNPIAPSQLHMNMSVSELMGEVKLRTFGQHWIQQLLYIVKAQLQILIGKVLMAFNYETSATDWGQYKTDMALNSDHRKFDDMLRVVISGSPKQRKQLQAYLQQQYDQEKLAYGMHITDAAMITCMVFQYQNEHVHFVDGKDGGYVTASKELKKRLRKLKKG
ncbi:DUF3095 domain-containing protein [Fodinibius halophilus]|uniref:DUF3095 domain-containing protein n=1 Tax=Fodinibius halophilus TaxID=1736908 RepID=A0A6M1SZZ5_9BACT|nr:DUF3095 domain-containing protein [Fodinibius halophilus]NGP88826.1 DUF3095 domain-containing protein [Fodinibius halophilus]